ncbi:hypothetical protein NIES80_20310 [Dolichospermum planctonicum]|uniref:Uncharacterized protein n=1 Tax=Dolichospermum planctonicum TaxID=136072 RepID=A0A480AGC8_9CYAN|nr:hypothetical protein NIES80_20310 [Dolichospermum planctonicum]
MAVAINTEINLSRLATACKSTVASLRVGHIPNTPVEVESKVWFCLGFI